MSDPDWYLMFGSAQRSVDSLPITPITGALNSTTLQDSLFSAPGSAFLGQEDNSPTEDTVSNPKWWTAPVSNSFGIGSLSTSPSQDCLTNSETDWAIPSAGLNDPLWSAGDLPLNPSKLNDTLTQPISHSGESNHQSAPGLTTASSTHSDVGDAALFGDLDFKNPPSNVGDALSWDDSTFRLPTSGPEVRAAPPVPISRPPLELDFYDRMNKPHITSTDLGFPPNMASFGAAAGGADEAQVVAAKEVGSATTNNTLSSVDHNEGSVTLFSTEYSEPRAVTIPNTLDDASAWLGLDGSNPFGATLDVSLDFPNYANWI